MTGHSRCYTIGPTQDNLKLEVSTTRFYLLPYHHMDLAEFETIKGHDTLTISFLNHRVRITGRQLTELADSIQARKVEVVKMISDRYTLARTDETGFVESIEVEAGAEHH
jgi:hypothetical protein